MPLSITDYHADIRDAMLDVMKAAIPDLDWHTVDDPDDAGRLTTPCGVVCCVGPEQDRGEWSTNQSDGIAFPVLIALFSTGTTHGEKARVPSATLFRRQVHISFHNQRLSAVSRIGWCEVSDSGPIYDKDSPAFQKLNTALVVTAVGRFPRS